jgi:HD-GYP domain-containing protein (c-di-GMP phosphodiesterase class II)
MSNGRPYKKALNREEIIAEFKKCTATHFDPDLTVIFLAVFEDDR